MALSVTQALRHASLPVRKYGDSLLPGLSSRNPKAAGDRADAVFRNAKVSKKTITNKKKQEGEDRRLNICRIILISKTEKPYQHIPKSKEKRRKSRKKKISKNIMPH